MSAALLTVFLAALYALDRYDVEPSMLRNAGSAHVVVYAIAAAAGVGCAFAPARRRAILLAAAALAAPIALGAWSAVWLGYAACVIAAARARVPIIARLAACAALWATVPLARWRWLDGEAQADTIILAILWAGQLYSAFYLVVERERELPAQRSTVVGDAFYLLALPRLVTPFFQPISPRRLARSERAGATPDMIRAAGLAAYAAGLAVIAWALAEAAPRIAPRPLALAVELCAFYARATYPIFTAVAMFRLLGFELPSGFRAPFLSRSFAEFFRRYNTYVRDAVLSLFYFPLLGRLRHRLPPRAASVVSAYAAIAVGSFVLHDLLIPMSTTIEPGSTVGTYLDPVRVAGFVTLWTLIIVPTAGIAPRREPARSRTRTILAIAAFNGVYFALWTAQHLGRGVL